MKKSRLSVFIEELFTRNGRRYPFIILFAMQTFNAILMVLLTAMPAQENAEFTQFQGTRLLVFLSAALILRNIIQLVLFSRFNKEMLACLSSGTTNASAKDKNLAWRQATSASSRHLLYEIAALIVIVLIPTMAYGYNRLQLSIEQLIYLGLAILSAGLATFILENLLLDRFFEPILQALLPKQFKVQLSDMKGMRLRVKLTLALIGLVAIALLLSIPAAYHQIRLISAETIQSSQFERNALLRLLNAGMGALIVSIFLSLLLTHYLSNQFRKMISMVSDVEAGDLNRRITVSSPDEFGTLNLYLNHMIERLQRLNSNLESQVAERTANLNQANENLQIELAERKRIEAQLVHSALHDPLTDLPNRALLMDRLNHAIKRAKRNKNYAYAVIFMDLDRFKVVNDSLGHAIGDLLLIECGKRLAASIREGDTVARLGGDEFVVLIEDVKDPSDYIRVARRIEQNLTAPAEIEGKKVFVSVSMGIVLSDEHYRLPEEILRDADIAMYRSKDLGRGRFEIFNQSMLESVMSRLELETDLWKAVEKQEFIVQYQPIMDTMTQRIAGFEALVRWQHPTRGLIPPAKFLPIAEEVGLSVPIGYKVLEEACTQMRAWQEQFPSDPLMTINVNLSNKQCDQPDLAKRIARILEKSGLDPHYLKLEMSESLVVEDSDCTSSRIAQLRDLGIQVHVDDFGTGFSSLNNLHTLEIDTLKIDRTFISRLESSDSGAEIVRTILSVAHSLGIKVTAEGVETDGQLALLRKMDCDFAQGFLFAEPMGSSEANALLEKSLVEARH